MEAHYPSGSKRTKILVILITAFIHLLLFFIFLLWKHHDILLENLRTKLLEQMRENAARTPDQAQNPEEAQNQLEKPNQWVSGQAQGAEVIYEQEPEHISVTQQEQAAQDTDVSPLDAASPEPEPQHQEAMPEEKEESAKPEEQTIPIALPPSTMLLEDPGTQVVKDHEQQARAQDYDAKPKRSKKKKAGPKLTLADLASGYMQKLHQASEHLVTSLGNNQGKITETQLKYERYFRKLLICLNNSHKIHRDSLVAQPGIKAIVYFTLVLARDGKLVNVHIDSSSGVRSIDDFALFITREAGDSFPPIPSYIQETAFPFCYMVNSEPQNTTLRFSAS